MPTKKKKTSAKKSPARKPAKKSAARATASKDARKDQLLDTYQRESGTTMKVLRAFPTDQYELRPHPRAKSARELAFNFVVEQILLERVLKGEYVFGTGGAPQVPNEYSEVLRQFEDSYNRVLALIRSTPDSSWDDTIQFPVGPGTMGDWKKLAFAWFILSDQIHHRGQFSVYLRMAGGRVPSIYGPSADEPWR